MKEIRWKKRYIIYILVLPIIFISVLSLLIKMGTIVVDVKGLIIDLDAPIEVGDYLSYYITILGIEVTTIFSYMLYKTSVESNKLSKAINEKEEVRDREAIRESAVIIYYDLIAQLGILKMMYTKLVLKREVQINRQINVYSEWIKNVANLKSILDIKELDQLIELYNKIECVGKLEDTNPQKEVLVKSLVEELILFPITQYLWMDYYGDIPNILSVDVYCIFDKIYDSIDDSNSKENMLGKRYVDISGDIQEVKWTDRNRELRYCFKYQSGNLVEGKFIHEIEGELRNIFDGKFEEDRGSFNEGTVIEFYESGRIKYEGQLKEGRYEGEGKLYGDKKNSPVEFEGRWERGRKIKGKYQYGNMIFNGEFKDNRPYTGEIEISTILKDVGGAYEFKGIIQKGKPIEGRGYSEINTIYSENYLKKHGQPESTDEDLIAYLEGYCDYEEIPYEVQQEMREDDERREYERCLEGMKEECEQVVELIQTTWHNGEKQIMPEDSLYKKCFGIK
ncbi:MAG: hypothetical protein ACRCSG_04110 [Cellulosilyticaceae bacterium]